MQNEPISKLVLTEGEIKRLTASVEYYKWYGDKDDVIDSALSKALALSKAAEPRTDSTDKDAQISEQIRVNKELREKLAKALYVLDVIARRYKYVLDEETHDHIQRQLNASPTNDKP